MNFAHRHWRRVVQRLFMAISALSVCGLALAQSNGDAPGRVARLSDLDGQVWLYTPDATDWVTAVRNRPLTTGDRLATDAGARAELQIGSTTLRLDANTELEVVQLDDGQAALQLHSGSAAVRIRSRDATREFSLTTAEGRFRVDRPGRYRFDRLDNASAATVYDGSAIYEARNTALTVQPGQRAEFWIDSAGTAQYSLSDPVRDAFASYNGDRDASEDRSASQRYVSPEMTGADDLDRYGSWEQSPDYGALWIPRGVSADWAPYSTGHWAYVRPWGWTWVDDAPWGFAPFHYGRWVYHRDVWCWAPGTVVARPIYAPALVAWIGAPGINVSVSIGGGGPAVGWFPLAPREVYVPSYRYSPRYARDINITNVTNVTVINNVINTPPAQRDFSNRRFPHALTVVPTSVVANRQPVAPAAAQLRGTPWVRNMAQQPAGRNVAALATPPVAAPVMPARQLGAPATRPPGFAQRTEGGRDRPEGGRDRPAAAAPAVVAPGANPGVAPAPIARPGENVRTAPGGNDAAPANARPQSPVGRPPLPTERGQPAVRPAPESRQGQTEERANPPAGERRPAAPAVIEDRRGTGADAPRPQTPQAPRVEERRAPPPSPVEQRRQNEDRPAVREDRPAQQPPQRPIEERRQIPARSEAPRNEAPPAAPAPVARPPVRQEQAPVQRAAPAPVERPQVRQERPEQAPTQAPRQVEAPQRPAAPPAAARQQEPRPQAPERREQREPRQGAQPQER